MIAGAAMAGLFTGAVHHAQAMQGKTSHKDTTSYMGKVAGESTMEDGGGSMEGNSCKGMHDCKGKNECKGQGGCATSENACKGHNECKGKGGCNTNTPHAEEGKF